MKKSEAQAVGPDAVRTGRSPGDQPMEKRVDTLTLSERAKSAARAKAARPAAESVPRKNPGETEEHWVRRFISYETASAWRSSSRQWREESKDMGVAEGVRYQGQKAQQWVGELMEKEPAMFREWLNREKWHLEEGELDKAILPRGFTEEDFSRWMEKDVLEYL